MKKTPPIPALLIIIALLVALVIGLVAMGKSQELRQKAATPGGPASIIMSPSSTSLTVGVPTSLQLVASIPTLSVDGFQVVASISGSIPANLQFIATTQTGLTPVVNKFVTTPTGKELRLAYLTENPLAPFTSTGLVSLGSFTLKPTTAGSMTIDFDQTYTVIAANGTTKDVVDVPVSQTYAFVVPTPTPTPLPTATSTPTPRPTATPTPIQFGACSRRIVCPDGSSQVRINGRCVCKSPVPKK